MNKMKRNVEEINRILKDEEFYIEYNEVQKTMLTRKLTDLFLKHRRRVHR